METRCSVWVLVCLSAALSVSGCTTKRADDDCPEAECDAGAGGAGRSGAGGTAGHAGSGTAGRAGQAQAGESAAGGGGKVAPPQDAGRPNLDDDADVDADGGGMTHTFDGHFSCRGVTNNGDSCSAPFVWDMEPDWTLVLDADHLSVNISVGFDKQEYSCDGSWTSRVFRCPITWSRAGRVCSFTSRVSMDDADNARFWPYDNIESEYAACKRKP